MKRYQMPMPKPMPRSKVRSTSGTTGFLTCRKRTGFEEVSGRGHVPASNGNKLACYRPGEISNRERPNWFSAWWLVGRNRCRGDQLKIENFQAAPSSRSGSYWFRVSIKGPALKYTEPTMLINPTGVLALSRRLKTIGETLQINYEQRKPSETILPVCFRVLPTFLIDFTKRRPPRGKSLNLIFYKSRCCILQSKI